MIFDFRKKQNVSTPVKIKSEVVERVHEYKYLGIVIDDKLSGSANTKHVYSKCIQRVHHLRILRNIHVDNTVLSLFYKSIIKSVICFSIAVWYGSLTCKDKNKLNKIVRISKKLGADVTPLCQLYDKNVLSITEKIMLDAAHPLNNIMSC
jgi:hypothetical protein